MLSDRRWRWDNSDTWHLQQELHLYPRINYFYSVKVAGQNVTFPRDLLSLGTESAVADVEGRTRGAPTRSSLTFLRGDRGFSIRS